MAEIQTKLKDLERVADALNSAPKIDNQVRKEKRRRIDPIARINDLFRGIKLAREKSTKPITTDELYKSADDRSIIFNAGHTGQIKNSEELGGENGLIREIEERQVIQNYKGARTETEETEVSQAEVFSQVSISRLMSFAIRSEKHMDQVVGFVIQEYRQGSDFEKILTMVESMLASGRVLTQEQIENILIPVIEIVLRRLQQTKAIEKFISKISSHRFFRESERITKGKPDFLVDGKVVKKGETASLGKLHETQNKQRQLLNSLNEIIERIEKLLEKASLDLS